MKTKLLTERKAKGFFQRYSERRRQPKEYHLNSKKKET